MWSIETIRSFSHEHVLWEGVPQPAFGQLVSINSSTTWVFPNRRNHISLIIIQKPQSYRKAVSSAGMGRSCEATTFSHAPNTIMPSEAVRWRTSSPREKKKYTHTHTHENHNSLENNNFKIINQGIKLTQWGKKNSFNKWKK